MERKISGFYTSNNSTVAATVYRVRFDFSLSFFLFLLFDALNTQTTYTHHRDRLQATSVFSIRVFRDTHAIGAAAVASCCSLFFVLSSDLNANSRSRRGTHSNDNNKATVANNAAVGDGTFAMNFPYEFAKMFGNMKAKSFVHRTIENLRVRHTDRFSIHRGTAKSDYERVLLLHKLKIRPVFCFDDKTIMLFLGSHDR